MALIFMDGFDKYGGPNSNSAALAGLMSDEWSSVLVTQNSIVAPLSATGQALQIAFNSPALSVRRNLGANFTRLIGGVRIRVDTLATSAGANCGIQFLDDAFAAQCSLVVNASTGLICLRRGGVAGTVIATAGSGSALAAGAIHYLEWDITFGNTAAYQIWLDGSSIISGTGDTTNTANNYATELYLIGTVGGSTITFDDLYVFDTTGSYNNAVLLSNPRIETTFPTADSAVQFTFGQGIIGTAHARTAQPTSTTANVLLLRRVIPPVNCSLGSINVFPQSSTAAQQRAVVYTDHATTHQPQTLLASGSVSTTGTVGGTVKNLQLTSPLSLTAGTAYWIGVHQDISVSYAQVDGTGAGGYRALATFSLGAPSTAPASGGTTPFLIWGSLLSSTGNWPVLQSPAQGGLSYVYDATATHADFYTFGPLVSTQAIVHAVAVKMNSSKSDTGTKTVTVRTKSASADSDGSAGTISILPNFSWVTSVFPTDPNTSAPWVGTALNAATSGLRIES